jgi:hypothetical protein
MRDCQSSPLPMGTSVFGAIGFDIGGCEQVWQRFHVGQEFEGYPVVGNDCLFRLTEGFRDAGRY